MHNNIELEEIIAKIKMYKEVVIYGVGTCGKFINQVLHRYNINPVYFLDINADRRKNIHNKKIYNIDDKEIEIIDKSASLVIICVMTTLEVIKSIKNSLSQKGYKNIMIGDKIYFSFEGIFDINSTMLNENYYKKNNHKINEANKLFKEIKSRVNYEKIIQAYTDKDFVKMMPPINEVQYFPSDILFEKGYKHFVDCGAYDGDTLAELFKIKGIPETVVAIEPDLDNFRKLTKYIREKKLRNTIALPCGVSKSTQILNFSSTNSTQSNICVDGKASIQCIAIDDVLVSAKVSFLKMDIEGEEYNALLGAKQTIINNKPDLAICVYHNFRHYFEIPLLLHDWNLGYEFYLRTYQDWGVETVLYATCKGEII